MWKDIGISNDVAFVRFMNHMGGIELDYYGNSCIWDNEGSRPHMIQDCLDHVVCNGSWRITVLKLAIANAISIELVYLAILLDSAFNKHKCHKSFQFKLA